MSATETLGAVVAALDRAGIAPMLAGSFASSLHGVARTTADIDLVVAPEPGSVVDLLRVRGDDLDRAYLDHWAAELGVVEQLAAARDRA